IATILTGVAGHSSLLAASDVTELIDRMQTTIIQPEQGAFLSTFTRHIFVCTNQRSPDDPRGSCSKLGSEALHAHFKQEAKRLDLKDIVRVNKAGCLDHCAQGPSVVIYPEGVWYQVKSKGDVTEIMERHVIKGEVVTRLVMPDHPVPTRLPPLKS